MPPLSPDEIVNRPFPTSFRGLAEGEVRAWLARIAEDVAALRDRERSLTLELQSVQQRAAAPPEFTEQQLVAALGDETTRVLRSAQEAAADIRRKAEERSVRIVREAQDDAKRLRDEAERLLGARSLEAEEIANQILRDAQARASALRAEAAAELANAKERALRETASDIAAGKEKAKEIVDEAHALRDKLVGDLGKRRSLLLAQIEELRSGRERLLDAYRTVKRTLDEATRALSQVESRTTAELGAREGDETGGVGTTTLDAGPSVAMTPGPTATPSAPPVAKPEPPSRPAPRSAPPLPPREPSGTEGPAVRVLGPRPPEPEPVPEVVEPVVAPVEAIAPPPPEAVPQAVTEPDGDGAADERSTAADIEALFARIRAARDEAIAEYEDAPAQQPAAVEPEPQPVTVEAEPEPMAAEAESEPVAVEVGPDQPIDESPAQIVEDAGSARAEHLDGLLQRRDASLDPLAVSLAKKLKRALQDEQNAALDALRQHRGEPNVDALLPGVHEHVASYVAVAVDALVEAYQAGMRSAGDETEKEGGSDLAALIENFARGIAVPLRDRIANGLAEAVRLGDDDTGTAERVNARYREWKQQRVETAVRDGLTASFAMGVYDATSPGEVLQWVVDDDGPCPDCDDNALEATPRGMPFPTGQVFPPAHPGCRCLIVPAAAVPE